MKILNLNILHFWLGVGKEMKTYHVLSQIKYSVIRLIAEKVMLMNKQLPPDKKIINLTMGQNYIGNPTVVIKRIEMLYRRRVEPLVYAPSLGTYDAREKVSKWFYRLWYGVEFSPNEVMISDGSMGAIRNAMGAIVRKGDIIVIDPLTFIYALDTLKIMGREYEVVVLDGDEDALFIPRPDQVIELLQELAIKNPHKNIIYYTQFGFNPVGAFRSRKDLETIVKFVDDSKNVFLIHDIVYHLIRFDSIELPLASLLSDEGRNIVDCDSLSKPFSLMGLRVGALITRDKEIFDASMKVQQYLIVSPNVLACRIWEIASDPEIFPEIKEEIELLNLKLKENFEMVRKFCNRTGIKLISPGQGTLYAFIESPNGDSPKFVDELIEKAKVALVPGTAFEVVPKVGKKYIRITISFPGQTIKKALERIEAYMSSSGYL